METMIVDVMAMLGGILAPIALGVLVSESGARRVEGWIRAHAAGLRGYKDASGTERAWQERM